MRTTFVGRRYLSFLGLVAGVLLASAPSVVSAQTELVTCLGNEVNSYNPGVLLTPRTIEATITRLHAPCVSTDPLIESGTISIVVTLVTSCLTVLGGPPGPTEAVVYWNTGETSTTLVVGTVESLGGVIVITRQGLVTSGKFAGATLIGTTTMATLPVLPCLSEPGVLSISGPSTMTILQP